MCEEVFPRSNAKMYRPSGDQRGLNLASDPGMVVTCRVFKSTSRISDCRSPEGNPWENAIRVPSADHVGSPSVFESPGSTSSGVPPCGEIRNIFHGLPAAWLI